MGRRRKQYISDDDLDSSDGSDDKDPGDNELDHDDDEDPDARAERLRFSDPYGRKGKNKRRRVNGKEEALYGIWAEQNDDDAGQKYGGLKGDKALKRTQAFVPASATANSDNGPNNQTMDLADAIPEAQVASEAPSSAESDAADEDGQESEDDANSGSDDSSGDERPRARVPRNRDEEEEEEIPGAGGIGRNRPVNNDLLAGALSEQPKPQPNKAAIGQRARGGIGSASRAAAQAFTPQTSAQAAAQTTTSNVSSVSGTPEPGPSRERRAFLGAAASSRSGTPGVSSAQRKPVKLARDEEKHFASLASKGGYGFKLLSKMGWSAGTGLGNEGTGIVTPLESKLRPKGMGLAYEGFTERTKQSKVEEKRRKAHGGEDVTDDDEESDAGHRKSGRGKGKSTGKGKPKQPAGTPAWKQPRPRKAKVQHLTYEEIVANATAGPSSGVGLITDLSGKQLSTSALSAMSHHHDVPTSDATRIPEFRDNLRLITDSAKSDLDNLAHEAHAVEDRRKWLDREDKKVKAIVNDMEDRIARLQQILDITSAINKVSMVTTSQFDVPEKPLEAFTDPFDELLTIASSEEFEQQRLDEVVVSAIAPTMKRAWADWDPLTNPTAYLSDLKRWKKAFRLQRRDDNHADHALQVDLYGSARSVQNGKQPEKQMTAFETMMWSMWMPRIRSAINNDWSAAQPEPAVELYSNWKASGLLPRFISDNILDQLILPKVHKAISDWVPTRASQKAASKNSTSLHHIVFPWLQHAASRSDTLIDEAKRRVRGLPKNWRPKDGLPEDLAPWRDVIAPAEWDNLCLQHIVPQLGSHLRERFTINPRQQELAPLQLVLSWRPLLRESMLSQLLEAAFFPKLLDALHTWLIAPSVNYEQVVEWYTWWKREVFANYDDMPVVVRGFSRALDLMNQAMAFGEDAKYRLKKPDNSVPSTLLDKANGHLPPKTASRALPDAPDVTFRNVVEELVAENNLLFMPTGKAHPVSGMALFRVSPGVDGRSGVTIYMHGDLIYAQDAVGTAWRPVSIKDMISRASTGV